MRTLRKNNQKMYYALQNPERVPVYDGYYEDEEGNRYPLETGEFKTVYFQPVPFKGNITMSGGESDNQEFGVDLSDYNAVLLMDKDELPITETSLIWFENEPEYDEDGIVKEYSADYSVVKISPSINQVRYVLKKVVK